jgi:hypothetical protein
MKTVAWTRTRPGVLSRYFYVVLGVWTIVMSGLFGWRVVELHNWSSALAMHVARAYFEKDLSFRLWGASHGGVYVPIGSKTQPNPYLAQVPERDIQTPSGKRLTLMNPAYMVRQLQEDFDKLYGVKGRITGLKHFSPHTAPDDWERAALIAFEKGAQEIQQHTQINEKPNRTSDL